MEDEGQNYNSHRWYRPLCRGGGCCLRPLSSTATDEDCCITKKVRGRLVTPELKKSIRRLSFAGSVGVQQLLQKSVQSLLNLQTREFSRKRGKRFVWREQKHNTYMRKIRSNREEMWLAMRCFFSNDNNYVFGIPTWLLYLDEHIAEKKTVNYYVCKLKGNIYIRTTDFYIHIQ